MSQATKRSQGRPTDLAEGQLRQRILHEAARLFAEHGFAGTSIQNIVAAAGTTKPMVYYYFNNKKQLYQILVEEAYAQVRQGLEESARLEASIEERLVAAVDANFNLYRKAPELTQFALSSSIAPPKEAPEIDIEGLGAANMGLVQRIIEEGIQAGELTGDSEAITLSLMGIITIYVMAQVPRPDAPIIQEATARHIVGMLLDGVRTKGKSKTRKKATTNNQKRK